MMIKFLSRSGFLKVVISLLAVAQLAACGGGGGSASTSDGSVSPVGNSVISGSVGDGPITGAIVTLYDVNGTLIATSVSDVNASYEVNTKASVGDYPLLLKVNGGIDLVTGKAPDFELVSIVMSAGDTHANINPFSTLIVKTAQAMPGGITTGNISVAKSYITGTLGFGLDTAVVSDPIRTTITVSNVANIVKSSEALGEMVRRIRDSISAVGTVISGDDAINAIAADMTDGFLDGVGANGTDPTVAVVANVISGQVLVEALTNNLRVGGVVATGALDQAIAITRPQVAPSQLTASVRITSGMLAQTQLALTKAQALDSAAQLTDLANSVSTISANALAGTIATLLPVNASGILDNAIALAPVAGTGNPPAPKAQTGSVTLSWVAPVARADGSALSLAEIGGYRVYYGVSAGNYTNSITVADSTAQSATLNGIPVGSYYMVMTTYDTSGHESGYSATVSKTVN